MLNLAINLLLFCAILVMVGFVFFFFFVVVWSVYSFHEVKKVYKVSVRSELDE